MSFMRNNMKMQKGLYNMKYFSVTTSCVQKEGLNFNDAKNNFEIAFNSLKSIGVKKRGGLVEGILPYPENLVFQCLTVQDFLYTLSYPVFMYKQKSIAVSFFIRYRIVEGWMSRVILCTVNYPEKCVFQDKVEYRRIQIGSNYGEFSI